MGQVKKGQAATSDSTSETVQSLAANGVVDKSSVVTDLVNQHPNGLEIKDIPISHNGDESTNIKDSNGHLSKENVENTHTSDLLPDDNIELSNAPCDKIVSNIDSSNSVMPSVKDLVKNYDSPPKQPIRSLSPCKLSKKDEPSEPPQNLEIDKPELEAAVSADLIMPSVKDLAKNYDSPPNKPVCSSSPTKIGKEDESFENTQDSKINVPREEAASVGKTNKSLAEGEPGSLSNDDTTKSETDKLQRSDSGLSTVNGINKNSGNNSDICDISAENVTPLVSGKNNDIKAPEFPLFPLSKGFVITLRKHLDLYQKALDHLSLEPTSQEQIPLD